jgi:photosystem II stability/assembly factor-like uncharacterized protein
MKFFQFSASILVGSAALLLSACATHVPTSPVADNAAVSSNGRIANELRLARAQKSRGREKMEYLHARNEFGVVPEDGAEKAYAARERLLRQTAGDQSKAAGVSAASWKNLGPGNVAGRTRMIVPHPTNPNILWAATARGGVWKTTDAGENWTPLTDALPVNAVSTLVVDPRDANTLYMGTGEYSGRRGNGIFVTKNGGASWERLASTSATANTSTDASWRFVNRIVMPKETPGLMLVATNEGIYRSTDGGATMVKRVSLAGYRRANGDGGDGAMDVKQDPNKTDRFIAGLFDGSVLVSEDNGFSWGKVAVITPDKEPRRVEVAFSASQPNVVYASVDMNDGELYRSTDAGKTWALIATPKHLAKQGDYDNAIWVHPTNPNLILLGGVRLYRSLDAGASFKLFELAQSTKGSNGFGANTHHDHHSFVPAAQFGPGNQKLYNTNDGGIWVMDNVSAPSQGTPDAQWRNINNQLVASQIYAHATDSARKLLVAGTQDTGLVGYRFDQDNKTTWQEYALGGDYFSPYLDPTTNYGYATVYYLLITRFQGGSESDVGATARKICDGLTDAPTKNGRCSSSEENQKSNFDAPILLDPNQPLRLYAGGDSLWVTNDARASVPNWTAIKPPSTALAGENYISAITVRPGNSNEVWVGHNNGEVYRTSNATTAAPTWERVMGLPARLAEAIVFDRFDPKTIYALFGGFAAGNLQISRDNGVSWAAAGVSKLPDASFGSISQHPVKRDWLYLGTFGGLFTSIDGGLTWGASNDGPAAASILSQSWLDNNTLILSTYGRGVFQATVDTTAKKLTVYELYNTKINHYFRTTSIEEANFLESLTGDNRWSRTGDDFGAWAANQDDGSALPVCRFYGSPTLGPNSHFYLVGRDNCIAFEAQEAKIPAGSQRWNLESTEFSINVPGPSGCGAAAPVPVYRIYNNRFAQGDSHHRYTSKPDEVARLTAAGWTSEGVVMCGMKL